MKTVYGKLANLIALLIAGAILFAPMRFGTEDYLYAHPRSVRMYPGDSYALSYRLDADEPRQSVTYTSNNESVATVDATGLVTAVGPGKAQILLDAENGARAKTQIEVVGAQIATLTLNTDALNMDAPELGVNIPFAGNVMTIVGNMPVTPALNGANMTINVYFTLEVEGETFNCVYSGDVVANVARSMRTTYVANMFTAQNWNKITVLD